MVQPWCSLVENDKNVTNTGILFICRMPCWLQEFWNENNKKHGSRFLICWLCRHVCKNMFWCWMQYLCYKLRIWPEFLMLYQPWIWRLYVLQKWWLWFASVLPVYKGHFTSYYEITCAHLLILLGVCSLPSLLQHSSSNNRGVKVFLNCPNGCNDSYSYTVLLLFCFPEDHFTLAAFSQRLSFKEYCG
jgi:hypothetical protein